MPKDFTTDIISLKHINASKYKSRSSQEENTKEEKKKKTKKTKVSIKIYIRWNDEQGNFY